MTEQRQAERLRERRSKGERFGDWLVARRAPVNPPPPVGPIETPKQWRTGICCSGGGIRSASYNLGALQVLHERTRPNIETGEFDGAEYLSAVSGGSYIAAALSIVQEQSAPDLMSGTYPYAVGSPEEQWLRDHSSYIAPGIAGKVRIVTRVLGGLVVNVSLLFLLLYVLGRLVGWAYGHWLYPEFRSVGMNPNLRMQWYPKVIFHASPAKVEWFPHVWAAWSKQAVWEIPAVVGLGFAFFPLLRSVTDQTRHFLTVWSTRLIGLGLVMFAAMAGLPYLVLFVRHELSGLAQHVGNTAAVSSSDSAQAQGSKLLRLVSGGSVLSLLGGLFRALWARKRSLVANLIAAVLGPVLLLAGFVWFLSDAAASARIGFSAVAAEIAAVVVFAVLYAFGDLTNWSAHPFYRRRLASAFALRRVPDGAGTAVRAEPVPPDELLRISKAQPHRGPKLVVCAAANIADDGATPPGRNAASFTFTDDFVGGPVIGTVVTAGYEAVMGERRRDLRMTLPMAVAVSGAAISPSMGKMTRRPLTFLFALANVRLGVWLPNPRWMEEWKRREERRGHTSAQLAPRNHRREGAQQRRV